MIMRNGAIAGLNIENLDLQRFNLSQRDIYAFDDWGINWEDLGVIIPPRGTMAMAISYLGNGIAILIDDAAGALRSVDYGLNWFDLGVIFSAMCGFVLNLGNGIGIAGEAAVADSKAWKTKDYGLTWYNTYTAMGASVQLTCGAYFGHGIVCICSNTWHIYRSTDYGDSFSDLGAITGSTINTIEYIGNGIGLLGSVNKHVWRTINYGLNWNDLGVISLAEIDYLNYIGNDMVLMFDHSAPAAHRYRSKDRGLTFKDLGTLGTNPGLSPANYLGNGVVICGGGDSHIYRSKDFGLNFTDLGVCGSAVGVWFIEPCDNGILLLADSTGHIFRSVPAFSISNFNPNQFDKLLQFGCLGAITPNGTSYLAPGNGATQTNEITMRVTRPGVLKNLYVQQRVASGAGGRTDIYTVRVNGVNTAITCTLNNETQKSDTVHTQLVAAGDRVTISLVSNDVADISADVVATVELV